MALELAMTALIGINAQVRNHSQSSGWATVGVILVIAWVAGIAAVLSAGGFW